MPGLPWIEGLSGNQVVEEYYVIFQGLEDLSLWA